MVTTGLTKTFFISQVGGSFSYMIVPRDSNVSDTGLITLTITFSNSFLTEGTASLVFRIWNSGAGELLATYTASNHR